MCVYGSLVYPGMAICVADKAVAKLDLLLLKKCSACAVLFRRYFPGDALGSGIPHTALLAGCCWLAAASITGCSQIFSISCAVELTTTLETSG